MGTIEKIRNRVISGETLSCSEAMQLWETDDIQGLADAAHRIQLQKKGNGFEFCSIINAKSGRCQENCRYCSQSVYAQSEIEVYPLLDYEKIRQAALYSRDHGIKRFSLVTSGRDQMKDFEKLLEIYQRLHEEVGISLCASLGFLDTAMAKALKKAGVTRYHHNIETARSYFAEICTTHTYEDKLRTIAIAHDAGLEVCSGGIMGMGESPEQLIEFLFGIKELPVVSIPLNFLQPIAGTPLEKRAPVTHEYAVRTVALARFIHPEREIRSAGGRYATNIDEQSLFGAGASGAITGNLLTTSGSTPERDLAFVQRGGFTLRAH